MNKVSKPKSDIYEMWEKSGQLPQIMDFIRDCARKLVTQREMCTYLNINESTFSRLKKAHPEIEQTQVLAKLDLKKDVMGALYKKAIGYETVEEEQFIEDKGKGEGQKRKIHRIKKQVPPDYRSCLYILTKHFGREYCERYEEMKMVEQRVKDSEDVWTNGNDQEDEYRDDEN